MITIEKDGVKITADTVAEAVEVMHLIDVPSKKTEQTAVTDITNEIEQAVPATLEDFHAAFPDKVTRTLLKICPSGKEMTLWHEVRKEIKRTDFFNQRRNIYEIMQWIGKKHSGESFYEHFEKNTKGLVVIIKEGKRKYYIRRGFKATPVKETITKKRRYLTVDVSNSFQEVYDLLQSDKTISVGAALMKVLGKRGENYNKFYFWAEQNNKDLTEFRQRGEKLRLESAVKARAARHNQRPSAAKTTVLDRFNKSTKDVFIAMLNWIVADKQQKLRATIEGQILNIPNEQWDAFASEFLAHSKEISTMLKIENKFAIEDGCIRYK